MKHPAITTLLLLLTALTAQCAATQTWHFQGKMGGRVAVEICFQTYSPDSEIVAGYIIYPRVKKPTPILLAGRIGGGWVFLNEYLPDGSVSGRLDFTLTPQGAGYAITEGKWTNPKTGATYSLTTLSQVRGLPDWWPGSALTPATPSEIPGQYEFSEWHDGYRSMLGGTAEFTTAGAPNLLNFSIFNCLHNIAEGQSAEGRPARLEGNQFVYEDLNECGYGLRAIFFRQFVVMQTAVVPESSECFGFGATLAGIYVKTAP